VVYQYPIEEHEDIDFPSFGLEEDEEEPSIVQGQRASKYEVMAAKALDSMADVLEYIFRYVVTTSYSDPDSPNRVDFMVNVSGQWRPVEIDHEWTHMTAEQQEHDRIRDSILNAELQSQGILPIVRVKVTDFTTQDDMYLLIQGVL